MVVGRLSGSGWTLSRALKISVRAAPPVASAFSTAAKATCRTIWIAAFRAAAVLEVPSEAKMGMSP